MKTRKPVQKTNSTSWGVVAPWYDKMLEENPNTFQEKVLAPNLERLVDLKPGMRVLDLACGQGFFSRRWAALGASVVASDISPELIALAQKNSVPEISYHVSPADDCSFAADGSFDVVTVVLALQNIERVHPVMREINRVLAPGGRIFIVLNHPTFRIPKYSSWEWDEKKRVQYRRIEAYLTEYKQPIEMHPGSDPSIVTFSFHRPLQLYFKHLAKNGFAVTHLEEWVSHRAATSGPRAGAENKARLEIPLFMCLEAIKKS
ncbi:MAG: class I SAM-dependent methyltransferase [Candidatus Magasanikbacteria bacterium]|nr:class I SAM-dependent methyltransferase [Candidatus Magasanikbacteria bacterium]